MSPLLQKVLLTLLVSLVAFSTYFWASPLVKKNVEKGEIGTCVSLLESLGKKILLIGLTGGKTDLDIYLPGELFIKKDYIELRIKSKFPLISQANFLPINSYFMPYERKKNVYLPDLVRNCSQVNCTWCLKYNCDIKEVKIGNYTNITKFAIFWIYDKYSSVCFTNDSFEDNYLNIDADYCFFEGEKYKNKKIFLIDEGGDYFITEGNLVKTKVDDPGERVIVVGKSIGGKKYITIFRLYILNFVDELGREEEIFIICPKNCWKTSGAHEMEIAFINSTTNGSHIRKFISIHFK